MSLSGEPDGKTGVRMSPSQETSRLWCVHDLSVGKAVCVAGPGWQCIRMQVSPMKIGEIFCASIRGSTLVKGAQNHEKTRTVPAFVRRLRPVPGPVRLRGRRRRAGGIALRSGRNGDPRRRGGPNPGDRLCRLPGPVPRRAGRLLRLHVPGRVGAPDHQGREQPARPRPGHQLGAQRGRHRLDLPPAGGGHLLQRHPLQRRYRAGQLRPDEEGPLRVLLLRPEHRHHLPRPALL